MLSVSLWTWLVVGNMRPVTLRSKPIHISFIKSYNVNIVANVFAAGNGAENFWFYCVCVSVHAFLNGKVCDHYSGAIKPSKFRKFWWHEKKFQLPLKLSILHYLDLDLGSGYAAYRHASLIDLYLHTKFHRNRRTVWWTDGHLTIRSTRRRRPKNLTKARFGRLLRPPA